MSERYRVLVGDLLDVGGPLTFRVLAGSGGRARTIAAVSIAEAVDVLDWVQPHDFVMAGASALGDLSPGSAVEALSRLVAELDDRDVAGMGVQLGPHLALMPPEVLALADERDFTIVELPAETPFDLLFSQVTLGVASIRTDVLRRTYEFHALLESLMLEGADLQRIADQIVEALSLGILVTSNDGREMADALTDEMRAELVAADLYDETGRFRVERVHSETVPMGAGQLMAQSIAAADNDLARLVAFAPNGVIGEDAVHALQRAANVLALLLTQRQALNVVESKYRGDFLHDVLSGRSQNQEYSEEYAAGLGWRLDMPCIVVAAQIDPQDPHEEPASTQLRRSWQSRFHLAWTQVVGRESKTAPCADFSDEVVVLLSLPDGGTDDPSADVALLQRQTERIVHSVSGDRGGGRRPFSVGTSRLVTSFDQLPAAYQQARRATEVGRRFSGGSSTAHFDDLGIHRLIGLIPDDQELTVFARDMLGELAEDTPHAAELRTTLQVLLDKNLNVAEASRELLMHYNTMRYRITKLEKIIGAFTTDANLRLNVAVALQVRKIQQ